MSAVEFAVSMSTHPGRVRQGNEDFCAASPEQQVFVVCDGMGGAAAGEVASRLAAETFLELLSAVSAQASHTTPRELAAIPGPPSPFPDTAGERLREAIRSTNLAVYRKARQTPGMEGMGTTLVAAMLQPLAPETARPAREGSPQPTGKVWIAHVGDSRCYLLRAGNLHLITIDHSVVEEQVQAGFMTRDEAEQSPMRNVITRAIGSQMRVEPEIQTIDAYAGDLLLLASDGLNRELQFEDIHAILTNVPTAPETEALDSACHSLIEAANANGGHDNITTLLLSLR